MIIYFHKRDFRLHDNEALHKAVAISVEENMPMLPIMGLETDLIENEDTSYEFSEFQQYGVLSAMLPLYHNYMHHGISPVIFHGSVIHLLEKIHNKEKVQYLISHEEAGTYGTYRRDKRILRFCKENAISWIQIPHSGIVRRLTSRDTRNQSIRECLSSSIMPIPRLRSVSSIDLTKEFGVDNVVASLERIKNNIGKKYQLEKCSEKCGMKVLQSFVDVRVGGYRGGISSPNSALLHGSRLSQFISYGSLSVRYIHHTFSNMIQVHEDKKKKSGLLAATERLHWRGHFVQRIEDDCMMPLTAINSEFNQIEYTHNEELFQKYMAGQTGEVLIDACIRCLRTTGFINFRMRALLVSYAVFGLDLDWRLVGRFLASIFLDYEPGIHWSQMQMQAGVIGINTIRVYSPHKQLLDQDPNCTFVKKWLPELRDVKIEDILAYPEVSLFTITQSAYPGPIVNFKEASKLHKLKTFGVKKASSKEIARKVYIKHGSRKRRVTKVTRKISTLKKEAMSTSED